MARRLRGSSLCAGVSQTRLSREGKLSGQKGNAGWSVPGSIRMNVRMSRTTARRARSRWPRPTGDRAIPGCGTSLRGRLRFVATGIGELAAELRAARASRGNRTAVSSQARRGGDRQ